MTNEFHSDRGEEVLEGWITAFRGPLVGLLASWGTDWRAAEELAQDTLAEAWVGRARFTGDFEDLNAVGAWVRGIAFNLHRTARRLDEQHNLRRIDGSELVAEEAPQPDERRVALSLAFSKLRATHQSVLRMHYLEQTSAREVAALLGLTLKAVEGSLYHARKALRTELDGAQTKKNQEVRG